MSLFDNILKPLGYISQKQMSALVAEAVKREIDEALPKWLGDTAEASRFIMPDPAIYANQADLYRLSPILGTAVEILSNDIGTAKFNVKRSRGEDLLDIPNHPFELLLRNPNPVDSGLELVRDTVSNYKLNGNAVWWLNKADRFAPPDEIWTIPFDMIQPVPDKRMYLSHWNYFPGNGATIPLETWEIVHFKTFNPQPEGRFVGLSPLESLIETIVGDLGMRKTNRTTYVEHGGSPPSILAFKDYPANDVWNNIKDETRQAAIKNQMMMLRGVGEGVTWLSRAMSSKDAEFIEGLKQNMLDVFNRMCPGLLAMLSENATEANALAARATYAEKTLWVTEEAIAQKITSDILPSYGIKLVGMYDDPRVVDKKMNLEEQSKFELTHTVAEIRKEYYQDDPLGDERDKLLLTQIKAESGGIQKPPPAPVNPLDLNQPKQGQDDQTQTGDEQLPAKAMLDDLLKYQRKALKKVGKAVEFTSEILPADVLITIKSQLPLCANEAAVNTVFENARAKLKLQTKTEPRRTEILLLAESINTMAAAMRNQ